MEIFLVCVFPIYFRFLTPSFTGGINFRFGINSLPEGLPEGEVSLFIQYIIQKLGYIFLLESRAWIFEIF